MPYIENIVDIINTELQTTWFVDSRFAGARYYGISETTYENKAEKRYPSIQLKSGEITPIVPDDLVPFTLWHRVDNIEHSTDDEGFGAKNKNRKAVCDVRLFAIVSRLKTKLNPNQFATLLSEGLPLRLTTTEARALDLNYVIVEPVNSNLRSKQAFEEEFSGEYILDSDTYMLVVRYRIETTYTRGCLAACACE